MQRDLLILVKHAMPVINPDAPPRTWPLSDAGRLAAGHLADDLTRFAPTTVVTSAEPKAADTGLAIARHLGVRVTTAPGLHEHERDGEPFEGTDAFHARMRRFFTEPDQIVYGKESADAAHARFVAAVEAVLTAHSSGTIVIVAHGTVITLLVARANGLYPFPFWRDLALPSFVAVERESLRIVARG